MPNNISSFLNKIPGQTKQLKDVDIHFSRQGDLKEIYDIDVLVRSITTLLLTAKGSYLFDSDFGCGLYKFIFDPADDMTKENIMQELAASLAKYEDRGNITYNVKFLKGSKHGFVIDLVIEYNNEKRTTVVTIDETILKEVEE